MKSSHMRWAAVSAALIGAVACNDTDLAVTNPNSGESARVLGTPNDAEALLGTYYKRWHSGLYGSTTDIQGMASVQSLMNYSALANSCLNGRTPFTGSANTNTPGNTCQGEQSRLYTYMAEVNRVASTFLSQVASGKLTLGSAARENRDKAFAEFLRGISLGYAAMFYDSTAVITAATGAEDAGVLASYKVVADSAYAALERAVTYANATATGDQGFPLPSGWIPSPTSWTNANFTQLVRSYRARIRANMARTMTERAAADWTAIVADAQAGFTTDHLITTNTVTGPLNSWRITWFSSGYHQMPPFFIGMADVSGSYAAWIAQPVGERGGNNVSFTMVTPDLRFPQGVTRAAQQADFEVQSCTAASTVCKRYFVNRPSANDVLSGAGFGLSNYDHVRFNSWVRNGDGSGPRNGPTPFMVKPELDMLRAEGLYRAGNFAAAAALVNITRERNGLPAITTFNATAQVPGGANCVPKVPVAPFNVIACGTLWDALKYEKRIETAYVAYAPWFLDERGWGELPKDTPLFWAVPYQDLQARGTPISAIYGAGVGVGNAPGSVAGVGVYGW